MNVFEKVLKPHIISGEMKAGSEIAIKIDQTLTQDSTGTMAYLQLEAMNIGRVQTELSVAYIDHNMLQAGFENADDHKFIQTVAKKHGIYFSRPGNGVCHQVHLERFGRPGKTMLGSDSHTPTCGALGMIAIGAGGLDVAVAMGGGAYYLNMPKVVEIRLSGKLKRGVSAKDIILEVLRRLSVKGGVGKVMEYTGSALKYLEIPQRATITNMGAELGATTSIFPSDEKTFEFLKAQKREDVFVEIKADKDAVYDETIEIDLSSLEPMVAMPHSPDNVVKVSEIEGLKVDQVAIGSCTNSSYADMMSVASILDGKTVAPEVSLVIAPGSRQITNMLANNSALGKMIGAGARILENCCGPCIGMGQSPATDAVSLRTNNRNFFGRSGTASAKIYLVSPETAAVSAITGVLTDPRQYEGDFASCELPNFLVSDNMIIPPEENCEETQVIMGPNIKPFPLKCELTDNLNGKVLIKLPDNITTDHIMPSDAKLLPFRSNVPHLAQFCLTPCDKDFPKRAQENFGGIILAGENYGQGSSREHAALAPVQLGISAVLAKSFARIHASNLINNGILPLCFQNTEDYAEIAQGHELLIKDVRSQIKNACKGKPVLLRDLTISRDIILNLCVSERQAEMLLAGGLINTLKTGAEN